VGNSDERPLLASVPIIFGKPIDTEIVLNIDMLSVTGKNATDLDNLFLLTRESMLKSGLYAYHDHLQATNKFYLAAVVLSDPVIEMIRRELRRLSDARLEPDALRDALKHEVIKREVSRVKRPTPRDARCRKLRTKCCARNETSRKRVRWLVRLHPARHRMMRSRSG